MKPAPDKFFNKHNLVLFDAHRIDTKGGSLRGFVAKVGSKHEKPDNVANMIEVEKFRHFHAVKVSCF